MYLVDIITIRGGAGGYIKKDSLENLVYYIEKDSVLVQESRMHLYAKSKIPVKVKSYSGVVYANAKDFIDIDSQKFRKDLLKVVISKGLVKSIEIQNKDQYNIRRKIE